MAEESGRDRKTYEKPAVESESLFDPRVLICGKCRGAGNVTKQPACRDFPRNS